MRNITLLLAGLLLLPIAAARADDAPKSSIIFEVHSPLPDQGKLTLLDPSQDSKELPSGTYTLNNPIPGDHTLFADSPAGTITEIKLYRNEVLEKTESVPQLSFSIGINEHLRIVVTYTLTAYGTIGVATDPPGMPFVLTGPAKLVITGVSPRTLDHMPIGTYGIQFTPKGCNLPPPQGNEIKNGEKMYFTLTLKCDGFQATRDPTQAAQPNGIEFHDVTSTDWFAPFAFQTARLNILAGYKDDGGNPTGFFGPSDAVTIAQLAKVVHVLMGIDAPKSDPASLEHKAAVGLWYQDYARSAEQHDWRIFIDPALDFNRNATRGEILVTFLQVMDTPLAWPKGNVFRDVNRRTPYASAIETAAALGIVQGKSDASGKPNGLFGPTDLVNRAELSKMISVILEKYRKNNSSASSK